MVDYHNHKPKHPVKILVLLWSEYKYNQSMIVSNIASQLMILLQPVFFFFMLMIIGLLFINSNMHLFITV